MSFAKIDSGILDSSMWDYSPEVRIVWFTMLLMSDETGYVRATKSAISRSANVPIDAVENAIKIFSSPDEESRTPDFEGRRVEKVDGGWVILNHGKYRAHESIKKDNHREYMKDWRKKKECENVNSREFTEVHNDSQSRHATLSVSVSESVSESKEGVQGEIPVNHEKPEKKKKPSIADLPLAFPSDNFRSVWENWLQHRKEKRSPLTPTAHKMQTAMLAAMSEDVAVAAINQSIKNGWAGLFEPKGNLNGSTTGNNRSGDDGCNVRPGFGDQIDEDAIRRASARKFAKILGEPDPHPESERPWADVRV